MPDVELDPAVLAAVGAGGPQPEPLPLEPERHAATASEEAELLRAALAVAPLDPDRWARLGQLLYERAVGEANGLLQSEAEEALDLARLLAWPWSAGPPLADYERMQLTRFGLPPRPALPPDGAPRAVRGAVLAYLADPTAAEDWLANFYSLWPEFERRAGSALRFWVTVAVTARAGDTEERGRQLERLGQANLAAPAWLAASCRAARRRALAPALARLREQVRALPEAGSILLEPLPAAVLGALTGRDVPVAVGHATCESIGRHRPDEQLLLAVRAARLAGRHGEIGAGLRAELRRRLVDLPIEPLFGSDGAAVDGPAALAAGAPRRGRLAVLLAAAEAVALVPPEARRPAAELLLETVEHASERPDLAVGLLAGCELPLADLAPIVAQATRGYGTAADHDRLCLAAIDALLRLPDPAAWELARFYSVRLDQQRERAVATLRLAAGLLNREPETAGRLAGEALRRARQEASDDPRTWGVRVEAARLLAGLGDPEGPAVLLDLAGRLPRRYGWLMVAVVRALVEAGRPEAAIAAAALRGGPRWLANACLGDVAPLPSRLPPELEPVASLLAAAQPAPELRPAILALLDPVPALRTDAAGRWVAVARKATSLDGLAVLGSWRPRPAGWPVVAAALFGEALEHQLDRRATEDAAGAEQTLRAACLERIRAAGR